MSSEYPFLPNKYHREHLFCERLIDEIESFILDDTFIDLRGQIIDIQVEEELREGEHILDYLLRVGEEKKHNSFLKNHIIYALLIDSVYFLKEALSASTKMRLAVTFALIRKPFVYNLVIILRVFLTSDFLEKFNFSDNFDAASLKKEDLQELISLSTNVLLTSSLSAKDIYNFIFNKELPSSLINVSNQALHPSTTLNRNNSTGMQNLNFIFSTEKEVELQWDYLYSRLPILLIYLNEILDFGVFQQLDIADEKYVERIENRFKIYSNR